MFSKRLQELRKNKGYSMDRLTEIYNERFNGKMNKSTLSRYEHGQQEPMYTVVANLSEIFNVSVDYLLGKEEKADISAALLKQYGLMPIKRKKFRMLGEIACGEPIFCNEEYDTFIDASANIDADFCLKAKGDSMINARIYDGDIVFIKQTPMVNNGEIAAVIVGDEATLKRVYYNKDNKLVLSAENPQYAPLVYTNEELNNINILGRAVAFMSYVK